ncbi:hypothetical protein BDN72DRAFT_965043 [Pluteus cervinus]|uniref:Uncharacterized protein n=1 Tax=Pluteus cervinus TaxID=181527 RepID=A0ACD3A7P3_9AGAR|nr:hypothetical protein BDN72DRAFT_965043 [Pluteus cervinus]
MDTALVLPNELWEHIFNFLPRPSVLTMVIVNKEFHQLGRPRVWRTLKLCSSNPQNSERIQAVFNNPTLATFVKDITIAEPYYSPQSRASLLSTALRRISPFGNPPDINEIALAEFHAIKLAGKVLSHLTSVRNMRVSFPKNPMSFTGSYSPYMTLWASLVDHQSLYNIRSLQLTIDTYQVSYLSQCINQASPIFQNLEEFNLIVEFWSGCSYWWKTFTILLFIRQSIRYLSYDGKNPPTHSHFPATSFGYLPNLVRFYQGYAGKGWEKVDPDACQKFLMQHRKTLTHLILKGLEIDALEFLWPTAVDQNVYPRLDTIHLTSTAARQGNQPNGRCIPSFAPYADSLTTLSLLGPNLSYTDVEQLVMGLAKQRIGSKPTALLRRLRFTVSILTPELFDLLSEYLGDLRVMDLSFVLLAADKARSKGTRGYNKEVWDLIKTRSYPSWNLYHVDARNLNRLGPNGLRMRNKNLLRLLMEVVPSIEEVGEIDWSDVDGEKYFTDSSLGL